MKKSRYVVIVFGLLCIALITCGFSGSGSSATAPTVGMIPTSLPDPPIVIEAGRCKKSFRSWWNFFWPVDLSHHDVYFDFIDEQSERQSRSRVAKGFFHLGSQDDVWSQLDAWLKENRVVWIPGIVQDRSSDVSASSCEVEEGPTTKDGVIDQIFQRFKETNWNQWHVMIKNCQHWADFVLDGTHPPTPPATQ